MNYLPIPHEFGEKIKKDLEKKYPYGLPQAPTLKLSEQLILLMRKNLLLSQHVEAQIDWTTGILQISLSQSEFYQFIEKSNNSNFEELNNIEKHLINDILPHEIFHLFQLSILGYLNNFASRIYQSIELLMYVANIEMNILEFEEVLQKSLGELNNLIADLCRKSNTGISSLDLVESTALAVQKGLGSISTSRDYLQYLDENMKGNPEYRDAFYYFIKNCNYRENEKLFFIACNLALCTKHPPEVFCQIIDYFNDPSFDDSNYNQLYLLISQMKDEFLGMPGIELWSVKAKESFHPRFSSIQHQILGEKNHESFVSHFISSPSMLFAPQTQPNWYALEFVLLKPTRHPTDPNILGWNLLVPAFGFGLQSPPSQELFLAVMAIGKEIISLAMNNIDISDQVTTLKNVLSGITVLDE